jgi:16S rRNA (guanine966-N2)-methyltransferase
METRPTSDKVREAIFAILGDRFVDQSVLDLFAGSGALGIEALSRGAAQAVFVERRPQACRVIRENLERTHLQSGGRVVCMPAERALTVLHEPFAVVLLDPPYAHPNLHAIMTMLGEARVVESDTTVVFEHSPRVAVKERYGRLVLQRRKVYGDSAVAIFAVQEEQDG